MKQKEKGFTLIELLAIIVILGIIAVIAVPTVKKLTDEAKLKAFENTARGIIKAGNLYYSRKDMMDELNGDMTFSFPDNAEELELQGKLPENGSMIINEDGDIALAISNKKYCITKRFDTDEIEIKEDYEKCKNPGEPIMTSENACIKNGICNETDILAGIKVNVKVNDDENYDFYVIDDTGTKLTLIMDRNLGENVAWINAEDYIKANNKNANPDTCEFTSCSDEGPLTALNELMIRTNEWINIPEIKYTYSDDSGIMRYSDFDIIMRSRILTNTEINNIKIACDGAIPDWLYGNLKNTGDNNTEGYWLSTANNTQVYYATFMGYGGSSFRNNIDINWMYGIRPVIEISK